MTAFLTKTAAQALASAYVAGEADRLNAFMTNLANSGVVGGTMSYPAFITDAQAQTVVVPLQTAGWTVVLDTIAKTVTVS